jgi:hypothetical protein
MSSTIVTRGIVSDLKSGGVERKRKRKERKRGERDSGEVK